MTIFNYSGTTCSHLGYGFSSNLMPISSPALGPMPVSLRSFGTTPFVGDKPAFGDSAVIIPGNDELVASDYHNGLVVLPGNICLVSDSGFRKTLKQKP